MNLSSVYNNHMKKIIFTCALATLLTVVGCGGGSSDVTKDIATPTDIPKDIATPTPIYSEDEILAMVQEWITSTCISGTLVHEMMSENQFSGEYAGDNSWSVGVRLVKDNWTGYSEYFTVDEQSKLVKLLFEKPGRKTSFADTVCNSSLGY